ncbi:MAG: hypothetical protein PWP27_2051 [Clostridiales bacterium]|jgi:hypothetical protein|nr:hypothetical protein [Clostridiales bacterium]MDK2934241.1 hypothetical protein [Clostridiales bacterium]
MDKYAVITADIIGSRKHTNITEKLNPNLKLLNKNFNSALLTEFELFRGDEIQAICNNLLYLPKIIRHVRYYCRPFKLRIGIGIGPIENFEYKSITSSWSMNGIAFHLARDSMDVLDKLRTKNKNAYRREQPSTYIITKNQSFDLSVNTIYMLIDAIVNNWKDTQWEAVMLYELYGTYEMAADHLGISYSALHQRCISANWNVIREAEKNMVKLMQ